MMLATKRLRSAILLLLLWVGFLSGVRIVLAAEPLESTAATATDGWTLRPVSFELDVQPVLTKAGCNSGPCHGKQRGQNGFQLSLLAFDSDFDFAALTREARGRRIFPASPANSLLLEKATGLQPHGGGKRFEVDSEPYRILLDWIQQGARRRLEDEPHLQSLQLARDEFSLSAAAAASLQLTALYSDGSRRDVTGFANYLSNDPPIASVDEQGRVAAGPLPGETSIMARYMNHICVAKIIIPQEHKVAPEAYRQLPRNNFIDELVYQKLEKAGVLPSPPASEAAYLRRVYTDIIGRLPTAEEARTYLGSAAKEKRRELVEALLDRPEYVDHWANQWADLLRPNPYRVGIKAVLNYDNWIREQFRQNVSYDEFARRLLVAKGSTWRNGAVTLYRDRRSPDEIATLVSQLFLGIRLECAKCHHHPFEKWSQKDFYQFAAFFGQVQHKGTGLSPPISGGEETVFTAAKGSVRHPLTGEQLQPQPLFGSLDADGEDARRSLAKWMTSRENEFFAKVQVNRLWAALMGRGLVEPVDDLRSTNPANNPELLDALAKEFVDTGYDCKHILRQIALSQVYALSSEPNETNIGDRLNHSRHYRHRLRAEVLMDAVSDVTEIPSRIAGMPLGARSNQIWTHRVNSMFLDTFGRPDPNQDPPCERTSDSTVTQALHLMNSEELEQRIRSDGSRAERLANSQQTVDEIAEELYLAIYSRFPTDAERRVVHEVLAASSGSSGAAARRAAIEDLMWAMLNTPEFVIQN
jgi:hypothetical protein